MLSGVSTSSASVVKQPSSVSTSSASVVKQPSSVNIYSECLTDQTDNIGKPWKPYIFLNGMQFG